jgi:hypothetical protein
MKSINHKEHQVKLLKVRKEESEYYFVMRFKTLCPLWLND